jgi:predicted O-methyltransferase YrrM
MQARMAELEAIDRRDRTDGTPLFERLRQIPAETGRFIAILAAAAPPGAIVEIGTSAGYSTMWLALAARASQRRVVTFEVNPSKAELAAATFRSAEIDDVVDGITGDAAAHLDMVGPIGFCFLDAEKQDYGAFYEAVVERLVPGGILTADNVISHRTTLQAVVDHAQDDPRLDTVTVPIGSGVLLGRRV